MKAFVGVCFGLWMSSAPAAAFLPDSVLPPTPSYVTKRYGDNTWQILQLVKARSTKRAPLVVLVMNREKISVGLGDLTDWLTTLLREEGFTVARISHQPSTQVGAREAAAQVARSIAYLKVHADENNIDASRIVLVGLNNGADSISLIACDSRLLEAVGVDLANIRGVVLIDGAYMDAAAEMNVSDRPLASDIKIYGVTPDQQRANSAIGYVSSPNVTSFYIATTANNNYRSGFSDRFADALSAHGVAVQRSKLGMMQSRVGAPTGAQFGSDPTEALLDYIRERAAVR